MRAASAPRTRVSTSAANARIGQVLAKRSSSKILGKRFTMTVWDTASGSYVFQRRADASLRGASTTKVLTSVGALAALGPDHRFATTVRAGATPDEVVLVAGGDPLLSSADLRALAASTVGALGLTPTPTDPPVPAVAATPGTPDPAASAPAATPVTAAPVTVAPAATHDHRPRRRLAVLRHRAVPGLAQFLPAEPGAPGGGLRPR